MTPPDPPADPATGASHPPTGDGTPGDPTTYALGAGTPGGVTTASEGAGRRGSRAAAAALVLAGMAAVAGCLAGWLAAGAAGLVAMASLAAFCAVLGVQQLRTASGAHGHGRRSPARPRKEAAVDPRDDFPRLRRLESELSWAATPGSRYLPSTRRLFRRHYAALLADRQVALSDEEAARAVVGAELWPYVCAADSPYAASAAPGRDVVLRLVDRLEQS